MVNYFVAVMVAELKNIFLNKKIITVMILGPIIYCFLYPQPYVKEALSNISIGILDQDNSTMSRDLIRNLDATKEIKADIGLSSMAEAEHKLANRQINGILVIPFDFEKNIIKGQSSPISFYGDASYILVYNNAATAINNVVLDMNSQISIKRKIEQGIDAAAAKNGSLPFSPIMVALFNPQSGYATYILPPAFILILHQLLVIGLLLTTFVSKERTAQLAQTYSSISSFGLAMTCLVAKSIVYLAIYLIMFLFYTIMLVNGYHIPNLANYGQLIILATLFLLTTTAFALAFSTLIRHIEDIFVLIVPISILLFFLSGISWPNEQIPSIIRYLAQLFPAVQGIAMITKLSVMGTPVNLLLPEMFKLTALLIFYFSIALYLYKRNFKKIRS